jgi:aryl-alcohol dehydrogenase-like predicted oxidoreductase
MFGRLGYVHNENEDWNKFEEVLSYLDKFVKDGKIRDIGLSNETPWGVSKCLNLAKDQNLPRMMSVQNSYNLLNRTYEVGLAEISIRDEIGLLGLLTTCKRIPNWKIS